MAGLGKVVIPIGGMHCQHCVGSVSTKLSSMAGVKTVQVFLDKGEALVTGTDLDVAALRSAIEDLGFDAGDVR